MIVTTNSKILFLIAHPDDEAYGPFGTIAKLAKDNQVILYCICNGARPGSPHVSSDRISALKANCEQLGIRWYIQNNPDCSLEYRDTLENVEGIINNLKPDIVYTHNKTDVHTDHRLIAETVLVACRPKPGSSVRELYFFELPQFAQAPVFEPTVYKDITDYIDIKKQALARYTTETYEFPDARSIEAVETLAKTRGYSIGVRYAEAFQLVFAHDHKN